jgi:hypothetical protein
VLWTLHEHQKIKKEAKKTKHERQKKASQKIKSKLNQNK